MQTKTRLGQWIQENKLSYSEVAALGGVSKDMVARVSRGERRFAAVTKVRFARRLGVHVSVLFDVDDQPVKATV